MLLLNLKWWTRCDATRKYYLENPAEMYSTIYLIKSILEDNAKVDTLSIMHEQDIVFEAIQKDSSVNIKFH